MFWPVAVAAHVPPKSDRGGQTVSQRAHIIAASSGVLVHSWGQPNNRRIPRNRQPSQCTDTASEMAVNRSIKDDYWWPRFSIYTLFFTCSLARSLPERCSPSSALSFCVCNGSASDDYRIRSGRDGGREGCSGAAVSHRWYWARRAFGGRRLCYNTKYNNAQQLLSPWYYTHNRDTKWLILLIGPTTATRTY